MLKNIQIVKEEHLTAVLRNNIHQKNSTFSIYKFPVNQLQLARRDLVLVNETAESTVGTAPEVWKEGVYKNLDLLVKSLTNFAIQDLKKRNIKSACLSGLALSVPFVEDMQTHLHFASQTKNIDKCVTYCLNYGQNEIKIKMFSPVTYEEVLANNLLDNCCLKVFLDKKLDIPSVMTVPVLSSLKDISTVEFNSRTTPHSMIQKNVYAIFLIVDGVSNEL